MKYTLSGVELETTEIGAGAFHPFNHDRPEAQDDSAIAPWKELQLFMDVSKNMTRFLDIGALFGVFSFMFCRNSDAIAYAVEASPWAYPVLETHCNLNPKMKVIPNRAFLGDHSGRPVVCGRDWKHVAPGMLESPSGEAREQITCIESTVDEMKLSALDIIKIDVESYEGPVLRGAADTLFKFRPVIFIECHLADLYRHGDSPSGLMELLTHRLNYEVRDYAGKPMAEFAGSFDRVICWPL